MEHRERIIHSLLGKKVHVEIDRPIGYLHGNIRYPVNYGYIPGVMAADGEEQDAYVLGVTEPLAAFDGRVIGVIRRRNDVEDKMVVAPEGILLHQAQIAEAVHFQEQYFNSTIDSLIRRSCGVIPFRDIADRREYLILLQTNHCWSFPKGHIEAGETEQETALRELFEETAMHAELLPQPGIFVEYLVSNLTMKQVMLFPGRTGDEPVIRPSEILDYRWVTLDELPRYLQPDTCRACLPTLSRLEISNN